MLFGYNTNVARDSNTYHVQTEDRGVANALIDTTVYVQGRVLHRRTNNYFDLLPLNPDTEQALKLRLDAQHRSIVEEIRSGRLQLGAPPAPAPVKPLDAVAPPPQILSLELLNAKSWLSGKHANMQIAVRDAQGAAIADARVTVRIDGAADPAEFSAETRFDGQANLEFDLPHITGSDPALVLRATDGAARGLLRFSLRARPRVPTT